MRSLAHLALILSTASLDAGVGETRDEIRSRYRELIFSVRETQPRGPVQEEYQFLGRSVEVFYENGLSAAEVFRQLKDIADAQRMLENTQARGPWKLKRKEGDRTEWEAGPLRAKYEAGVLRVSAAKEGEAR